MYFQLVDNQVLSTQGQPDVNLHRLTVEFDYELFGEVPDAGVVGPAAAVDVLHLGMRNRLL